MTLLYRIAADVTVVLHFGYAFFILAGQILILIGLLRRWQWIRNIWFRVAHLAAIVIVVVESLLSITCPLTVLEKWCRDRAGQSSYQGDFLANAVRELLFVDLSPAVLGACYGLFGVLVALSFVLAPPRRRLHTQAAPGQRLRERL